MQETPPGDGRARRRIEAMRRVQDAALELFEEKGYGPVAVEAIAARAGVGPATVYRNFGTKERIVLWDEYDPMLFEAIRAELRTRPPAAATLRALEGALGRVYTADRGRILRRARLILAEPALQAASAADRDALRRGLAELFLAARSTRGRLQAEVTAGAIAAALEAAIAEWVRRSGRVPLGRVLRQAFSALERAA